jgi:hypothetical protein
VKRAVLIRMILRDSSGMILVGLLMGLPAAYIVAHFLKPRCSNWNPSILFERRICTGGAVAGRPDRRSPSGLTRRECRIR